MVPDNVNVPVPPFVTVALVPLMIPVIALVPVFVTDNAALLPSPIAAALTAPPFNVNPVEPVTAPLKVISPAVPALDASIDKA